MCSVFYDDLKAAEIQDWFRVPDPPELPVTPLIYPGYQARIVANNKEGQPRMRLARWGLAPNWVTDPNKVKLTFNARAETVAEKPTFAPAFRKKRCLLVGRCYFEWIGEKGKMQPVRFSAASGEPLCFAALWEVWRRDDREVISCTMATTEPNAFAKQYHDRMPALLSPEEAQMWIAPDLPLEEAKRLLAPADEGYLAAEVWTRAELEALR